MGSSFKILGRNYNTTIFKSLSYLKFGVQNVDIIEYSKYDENIHENLV